MGFFDSFHSTDVILEDLEEVLGDQIGAQDLPAVAKLRMKRNGEQLKGKVENGRVIGLSFADEGLTEIPPGTERVRGTHPGAI
jgi:hypothetical protein